MTKFYLSLGLSFYYILVINSVYAQVHMNSSKASINIKSGTFVSTGGNIKLNSSSLNNSGTIQINGDWINNSLVTTVPGGICNAWTKRYSGSDSLGGGGFDIDVHGHIFVAGMSIDSSGFFNPTIIKYDSSGNQLWAATYQSSVSSYIVSGIAVDDQCNAYIIATIFEGANEGSYSVLKYNGAGDFQWIQSYSPDGVLRDIIIGIDGGIYVAGQVNNVAGNRLALLIKHDNTGQTLWTKTYFVEDRHILGMDISSDSIGNIYFTGIGTSSSGGFTGVFVFTAKYDTEGNELWIDTVPAMTTSQGGFFEGIEKLSHISTTLDTNVIVSVSVAGVTDADILLLKYDTSGNLLWDTIFGENNGLNDFVKAIEVNDSAQIYVTGTSADTTSGAGVVTTLKYSPQGSLIWNTTYDNNYSDEAFAMSLDPIGNVYITGTTLSNPDLGDYLTIKYNLQGVLQWTKTYEGTGAGPDFSTAIRAVYNDVVYITGLSAGGTTMFDFATIKFTTGTECAQTDLLQGGDLKLIGNNDQKLRGTQPTIFDRLIINMQSINNVIIQNLIYVKTALSLQNGIIETDSIRYIIINPGARVTGGSANSFISGPVKKIGNTSFVFPVGKGGNFQPLGISAPSNSGDAFTAEYFNMAQGYGSNKENTLKNISTCEYWNLSRNNGSSKVAVTLYWNANSCNVTQPTEMLVAHWDGTKWVNFGNGGYTGNSTAGSVTTAGLKDSFSPFTLGQNCTLFAAAGNDASITPGQTVTIGGTPAAGNGTAPFAYFWSPAYGLSSSSVSNPYASPPVTTTYSLIVTDADLCFATDQVLITVIQSSYVALRKKLDGHFYKPFSGNIKFIYREEYIDSDGLLNYSVYDPDNAVVLSGAIQPINGIVYGSNKLQLNVSTLASGYYVLEVSNDKLEKWYLRFNVP